MRNTNLQGLIDGVMNDAAPGLYKVTLKITSMNSSGFSFSPIHISDILISQRFDKNFMDDIHVEFPIATADYAKIYDNMQDLMAYLTFQFLDRDGRPVLSATPVKRMYRLTIVNARDVRRQFPDADLRVNVDTSVVIRLIEPEIYPIRQKAIVGTHQSTTVEAAMHYAAMTFGIETAYIVPPDNTHVYDHIVVPPAQKFSEYFYWLQSKYGVYSCGITNYYTGGILYVYAPFDLTPAFPYTASFYQADEGDYAGANSFYQAADDKSIKIVVNNRPESKDLSQSAAENVGTASMFMRASKLIDGVVAVDNKKGASFIPDVSVAVRLNDSKIADSSNVNSVYTKPTDNAFANMSMIIEHQALLMTVNWPQARPFSLAPGEAAVYYSSESNTTKKRNGIVESVEYAFTERERTSSGIIMACMGRVVLRLQPTATNA